MSQEIIYWCDKCGEKIIRDRHELHLLYTDEDASVAAWDLCPLCVDRLGDWIAEKPPKKKAGRPKKIDEGKVKALTDAGWDVQKIADEMNITESQVRHALSFAEKKDE